MRGPFERKRRALRRAAWGGLLVLLGFSAPIPAQAQAGWGLNSRISQASPGDAQAELRELDKGRLRYLREDITPGSAAQMANLERLRAAGYRVVGLIPYGVAQAPQNPQDSLDEDLREVYLAARDWAVRMGNRVPVWENYNEPDLGFCRDLPDRSTAYFKAVYLGLKAGSGGRRPVILPAIGLPPDPWLQRATANGLLAYGDALNFHYYGRAEDFPSFLKLIRNFVGDRATSARQRRLPLWITEIGLNAATADGPGQSAGRRRQADFLRETAQAAVRGKVAAFLPYAYRDAAPGFSLTRPDGGAYPAMDAYLEETDDALLSPENDSLRQPAEAPPVIAQWLPDAGTCLPDKAGGAYEFVPDDGGASAKKITGEIYLYNFSERERRGAWSASGLSAFHAQGLENWESHPVSVPPMSRVGCRVTFSAPGGIYARERLRIVWKEDATGQTSPLEFGLQTMPRAQDFRSEPIVLRPVRNPGGGDDFQWIGAPRPYAVTSRRGAWLGINGVEVDQSGRRLPAAAGRYVRGAYVGNAPGFAAGAVFRLSPSWAETAGPAMAIARVDGLPPSDFLRITADRVLGADFRVRADLIDDRGRRFTIFENDGTNYFRSSREAWLNWKDFHLYFWGRLTAGPMEIDPGTVRQIQLRLSFRRSDDPVRLKIEAMRKN